MSRKLKDFEYNIGQRFTDDKRDIEITDRCVVKGLVKKYPNIRTKIYKCKCYKCGDASIEITENHMKENRGCPTCHSKKITKGINDVATTSHWMVKYFINMKDAYSNTSSSNKMFYFKCPFCGRISKKKYKICEIKYLNGLPCICKDGYSFPEKFMLHFLEENGIEYIYQASKSILYWAENRRYDFYIPKYNCIIETHGAQHYEQHGKWILEDQIKSDNHKRKLANENRITNYIEIDCRQDSHKYIIDSILRSGICNLFDIDENSIDWNKILELSTENIVKNICDYKNSHLDKCSSEISRIFKIDLSTVIRYLERGSDLGWYDKSKDEYKMGSHQIKPKVNSKFKSYEETNDKRVVQLDKSYNLIKVFDKLSDANKVASHAGDVCRGKWHSAGGFIWMFYEDYSDYMLKANLISCGIPIQ